MTDIAEWKRATAELNKRIAELESRSGVDPFEMEPARTPRQLQREAHAAGFAKAIEMAAELLIAYGDTTINAGLVRQIRALKPPQKL